MAITRDGVLDWMNRPLPADHKPPVTLGVTEPFTITIMVSIYAGFVLALRQLNRGDICFVNCFQTPEQLLLSL